MAALKMGSSPDLAKTHKTGNLKYWPSFVSMIRDKTPFRKGAKGEKGTVTLGYKAAGQQKKLVAAMSKITTGREVIGFLNERNAEMPVVGGGKVKITELWKENVKESKASTTTKIGGRDTEVYSEILVQFCLAYRLIYGKRATHADISDGDDYKPDILKSIRRRSFTGGKHSLTSKVVRKNLKQFSRQISDKQDTWLDSASATAEVLVDRLPIPSDGRIYNDKIFGSGNAIDPYRVYLAAKTGLKPDKWNPADIWIITPQGARSLRHFNQVASTGGKASVPLLNNFLIKEYGKKDIIPISLKKTKGDPKFLHYTLMNSDQFAERISLSRTSNPTIELTRGNRDMKINFTLETVELNKGVNARNVQSRMFGNIGKVVPGSEKHIRIKYNANKKQLEVEYTQTKGPNIKPTALAKMGSMGGDAFTKIISKTSSQGISDLDKIKDNHKGLSLTKGNMFISQPIKFRPEQYDEMVSYMNDIWMEVNGDNIPDMRSDSSIGDNVGFLKDKLIASEISIAIKNIKNDKVKRRVIQHLYNTAASIGFGSGLNKEEKELMEQSGMGQSNKMKSNFIGGLHVKVY
tara:strand:- start:153 stop:1880 length:1728 start_codon:yes stop_codon:yes gene_type:complete